MKAGRGWPSQCGGREATLIHSLLVSTCPRVLHSACCTPTPGAGPSAGRDLEPEPHLFPFLRYSFLSRTQPSSDMWAVAQDRGCVVCVAARPLCGCGPWRLVFVLTKLGPSPAQPGAVPQGTGCTAPGGTQLQISTLSVHTAHIIYSKHYLFFGQDLSYVND